MTEWVPVKGLEAITYWAQLAVNQGTLRIRPAIRFCWSPRDPKTWSDPDDTTSFTLSTDTIVRSLTAVELSDRTKGPMFQAGFLAWHNTGTSGGKPSYGYAGLQVNLLSR